MKVIKFIKKRLAGFTLIEIMISTGIIVTLMTSVIVAVSPTKILLAGHDVARKVRVHSLEKAYKQATIANLPIVDDENVLSTEEAAINVCREGMVRDSSCINLDSLIDENIISKIPSDFVEPCDSYSGYKVYKIFDVFRIFSKHTGKLNGDDVISECSTDTIYPEITFVEISDIGPEEAKVTWTTDEDSTSKVDFGTSTSYGGLKIDNTDTTTHSVVIDGLSQGTLYHIRVGSIDDSANNAISGDYTFTTLDATAPVLSGVTVDGITDKKATMNWNTDELSNSNVKFWKDVGETEADAITSVVNGDMVMEHSFQVTEFRPNTTYRFRALSADTSGNMGESAVGTVTTGPDNEPPIITNVNETDITSSSVVINWTTDEISDSKVEYGADITYGNEETNSSDVKNHSLQLNGLTTGNTYFYRVVSKDPDNNEKASNNYQITIVDTSVPELSNVAVSDITTSAATISWDTNEPANTQVEYGITNSYGSMTTLDASYITSHTVPLSGLQRDVTYYYRIITRDPAGWVGEYEGTFFNDINPPVISDVEHADLDTSSVTVTWTTDEPSTSQVEYGTTIGYGSSTILDGTLTTNHSVGITGLSPNTTYNYRARSVDAHGNEAASSNSSFFYDNNGPAITDIVSLSTDGNGVLITWNTDESSRSKIYYGVDASYGSEWNDSNYRTSHTVNLLDLTAGTHHYKIEATDAAGNTSQSADYTFIINADTTPPVFDEISVYRINGYLIQIRVRTDEFTRTSLECGTSPGVYNLIGSSNTLKTTHYPYKSSLSAGTDYYCRFVATDPVGNQSIDDNGGSDYLYTTEGDNIAPSVIDFNSSNITLTSATVSWDTDENSISYIRCRPSDYSVSWIYKTNYTMATHHEAAYTGLVQDTEYYCMIYTRDISQNYKWITIDVGDRFSTLDPTAPVISNVSAGIGANTATITWDTNEPADTQVEFGTTIAYGSSTTLDATDTTSHSAVITGLIPNTLYHYRVLSRDTENNLTVSGDYNVTIPDPDAPTISNVLHTSVTNNSATITWDTNEPADTQVEFGTTDSYGNTTTLLPSFVESHTYALSGLMSGINYHYRVLSRDSANNSAISGDYTFATSDSTPPNISGVVVSGITSNNANIFWITDEDATGQIHYGETNGYGYSTTLDGTFNQTHNHEITSNLSANTLYHYQLVSRDNLGNEQTYEGTFTTNADIVAPEISDVTATILVSGNVNISWTTNEPADTQIDYGDSPAYGNTITDVALTTSHSKEISGLDENITYHYLVKSRDAAGNLATSINYFFLIPDEDAPEITDINVTIFSATSADVTWTTNEVSNSQIQYGLTNLYGMATDLDITLVTSHTQRIEGLTENATYHFLVRTVDESGNLSISSDSTFITDFTPPVITDSPAPTVNTNDATIEWTTDEQSDSQIKYSSDADYDVGLPDQYANETTLNSALNTAHSEGVTGLTPDTTYHYRIFTRDTWGNLMTTGDRTFTTLP